MAFSTNLSKPPKMESEEKNSGGIGGSSLAMLQQIMRHTTNVRVVERRRLMERKRVTKPKGTGVGVFLWSGDSRGSWDGLLVFFWKVLSPGDEDFNEPGGLEVL